MKKKTANSDTTPLAIGTGLVALDVVISDRLPKTSRHWAGGTCGNVLLALRYLGWRSAPVARLQEGPAAARLLADLDHWGVTTSFISLDEDGSTPLIVQKISRTARGEAFHTFSWRCLKCGSRLPGYKPVLATSAEQLVPEIKSPKVFFFDRLSRGAILLARACAEQGAAVIFEPSSVGNPALFREAWGIANVVKYSHERLHELPADLESSDKPQLQIETTGKEGLRYRTRLPKCRKRGWQSLAAISAPQVNDTAGAGDWCTAGLIHKLFRCGSAELFNADDDTIQGALRYGQALAAWTCGFEGARGGMYESTKAVFERDIATFLGADTKQNEQKVPRKSPTKSEFDCLCPSCDRPAKKGVSQPIARVHASAGANR